MRLANQHERSLGRRWTYHPEPDKVPFLHREEAPVTESTLHIQGSGKLLHLRPADGDFAVAFGLKIDTIQPQRIFLDNAIDTTIGGVLGSLAGFFSDVCG